MLKYSTVLCTIILCFALDPLFSQELQTKYQATHSYDLKVSNEVIRSERDEPMINDQIEVRIFHNETGDFVIMEMLSHRKKDGEHPLELSLIDFQKKLKFEVKDKTTINAEIGDWREPQPFRLEKYDWRVDPKQKKLMGFKVNNAIYEVNDSDYTNKTSLIISEEVKAPSYLKWMPLIQKEIDLFPLELKQNADYGNMKTAISLEASNFKKNSYILEISDFNLVEPEPMLEEVIYEETEEVGVAEEVEVVETNEIPDEIFEPQVDGSVYYEGPIGYQRIGAVIPDNWFIENLQLAEMLPRIVFSNFNLDMNQYFDGIWGVMEDKDLVISIQSINDSELDYIFEDHTTLSSIVVGNRVVDYGQLNFEEDGNQLKKYTYTVTFDDLYFFQVDIVGTQTSDVYTFSEKFINDLYEVN